MKKSFREVFSKVFLKIFQRPSINSFQKLVPTGFSSENYTEFLQRKDCFETSTDVPSRISPGIPSGFFQTFNLKFWKDTSIRVSLTIYVLWFQLEFLQGFMQQFLKRFLQKLNIPLCILLVNAFMIFLPLYLLEYVHGFFQDVIQKYFIGISTGIPLKLNRIFSRNYERVLSSCSYRYSSRDFFKNTYALFFFITLSLCVHDQINELLA